MTPMTPKTPITTTHDCELCIVGAGYAGLNALNAAAKYLRKGDRVVVLEKNADWGGQWLAQYDFVRLHQPYRMFTAGDQPWALKRPPEYLATKPEVIEHLKSVPSVSAGHLEVVPLFGHGYEAHRVEDGRVVLETSPVDAGTSPVRVRARRLLHATGADIHMLPPFPVSSTEVRSVGVSDPVLGTPEFLESNAPVYIVGSGKTAMDVVMHLARAGKSRAIHVLAGSGMYFFRRDTTYVLGWRRHVEGHLAGHLFLDIVDLFDGQNERAVMERLERDEKVHTVFGDGGNCRFALLAMDEAKTIRRATTSVIRGHLVDIEGTTMTYRLRGSRGELQSQPIEAGAWVVNCTSHLRAIPHAPVLSDGGLVARPQFVLGFTGTSSYFVTHLWYRGLLDALAGEFFRIRIDTEPKLRFAPELGMMVAANMVHATRALPFSVPASFLGDFNKWYPLHRQLGMVARMTRRGSAVLRKAERLLPLRFTDGADADLGAR